MSAWSKWFAGKKRENSVELRRAQLAAFSKQVPLLYFVVNANSITLAYTHYGIAPDYLTVAFPAVLAAVSLIRVYIWLTAGAHAPADKQVGRLLGRLYTLGIGIGLVVISWTLALYTYGDVETRGHVAVVVGITVFAGTFLLMHVRRAALAMTSIVTIPFVAFLLANGSNVSVAIAVNLMLVTGAMVIILFVVSADFENMVDSQVETRRLSDENARLAAMDSLTGLPNRRLFFTSLDRLVERSDVDGSRFSVAVVDLDGFKPVNDTYGHVTGDLVLVQAAERLQAACRERAVVTRLGGDEFGIVIPDIYDQDELLELGLEICSELTVPFATPGSVANITGSIGFAIFPEAGTAASELYESADFALYHAKQHHRGRPVIFSEVHETKLRRDGVLEQCLRRADLDREMWLMFQPQFDVIFNRPVAFEALARWKSPELGNVSPEEFIPVAERTEIISKLTQVLLRKALEAASAWPDEIRIAFNLSTRDLVSSEQILQIIRIVQASGVQPDRIDFELTESLLVRDFDQGLQAIRALKALGAHIVLDDFGTGYSSLNYVHKLPPDKIKIDRSFVADIENKEISRDVVSTIIGLCQNLRIPCVVEGVETQRQADILRDLGCNAIQGHLLGRPLTKNETLRLLAGLTVAGQTPMLQSA